MTSYPPVFWDIVSNLNLQVKKIFYEQLSKHRDNEIIEDIYSLTSKQSTSRTWFSFREDMFTASTVHEALPKLNSKFHCMKIKLQPIYVQRYLVTKGSQKRVNL